MYYTAVSTFLVRSNTAGRYIWLRN